MAVKKKARKKAKKRVKTKSKVKVGAKSRATGKRPTARLKKRRKANVEPGYYPNPTFYVAYLTQNSRKYFYHGYCTRKKHLLFDDDESGALWYRSRAKALTEIGRMMELSMSKAQLKNAGTLKVKVHNPK